MPTSDLFAAFRWWTILMLIGFTAVPLTHTLFHKLPDRGYAFSKMLGLLIASYIFWLMASLGFVDNSTGSVLLGVVGLVVTTAVVHRFSDGGLWTWLRENRTYILTAEVAFTLLFILWVWVRANNPGITATEKPMEFAFLNAASRSPVYPPLDPWLSGFAISYYYFGYVMMSVLARLAAVPEMIAFNLGMAWLVAGSGLGAFGLVYNLIAADQQTDPAPSNSGALSKLALGLGLVAFLALPLAGNGQMLLETLHGNNIGTAVFWEWLDIRDINQPPQERPRYLTPDGNPASNWWWWRSSRVLREYHLSGRAEDGLEPIAEFPGFSFVLGDMHPHVLALPFAFLSLAVAFLWYLSEAQAKREDDEEEVEVKDWRGWVQGIFAHVGWGRWLATAVVLGGLAFLNTWDFPIHLFVIVGAFALGRWRRRGQFDSNLFGESAVLAFALLIPAYFLYWPFYLGFSSQAGAPYILPMVMQPTRLVQYLVIFGMPLLPLTLLVGLLAWQLRGRGGRSWRPALAVGVGLPLGLLLLLLLMSVLIASNPMSRGAVLGLANELGIFLPNPPDAGASLAWGITAVSALAPTLLAVRVQYIGLTLFLATLLGLIVYSWHAGFFQQEAPPSLSPSLTTAVPFALLLMLTGLLLSIGPEYVYLRDNFGQRLNTIFKFYYQAWLLFGTAALYALGYLLQHKRKVGVGATAVYALLLLVALTFPLRGAQSRAVEYRGANLDRPATLNGLDFLRQRNPDEYEAIMWLRENVAGAPVILETTGNPYSDFSRVSANTGLPTVLGWANHQYQWRGDSTDEPGRRGNIVRELFDTPDWNRTVQLLNEYQVRYIFIGSLEKGNHNPATLQKFSNNLTPAFQNESVTIYRWQPE